MRDRGDIDRRLETAAAGCLQAGARLTELRREVFKLILEAEGAVGAYSLLDRLRQTKRNAAPPTIYRALEFLLEQGLVHRVERLNAFIPCDDGGRHEHDVQFLICSTCGGVDEVEDGGVMRALRQAADAQGFKPGHATVEVEGTCAACAAAS